MKKRPRLDGKVAVITGAGRGIGRATAMLLARAGASVVAASRTIAEIEEVATRIVAEGGKAAAVPADIRRWGDAEGLAASTARAFGPADIVIANAAVIEPLGPVWELNPAEWAGAIETNLSGAYYTVRAFLPAMVERRSGIVIFVSSGAAESPIVDASAYCASKAGLERLLATLSLELKRAQLSVRAHGVRPGVVDTSMQEHMRSVDVRHFSEVDHFRRLHARGELHAAQEPAALIYWLTTPHATDLHGRVVGLDDPTIRRRLGADLGLNALSETGGSSRRWRWRQLLGKRA